MSFTCIAATRAQSPAASRCPLCLAGQAQPEAPEVPARRVSRPGVAQAVLQARTYRHGKVGIIVENISKAAGLPEITEGKHRDGVVEQHRVGEARRGIDSPRAGGGLAQHAAAVKICECLAGGFDWQVK